ncbi:MAG: ribonuclease D [Verrucomicrobiales bacterium]|nr:hypothetical protein [Verrucomicrobiota bacterium JB025]
MIDTTERLVSYLESCKRANGPVVCAIDTEADSLHRYKESLCLVQFAIRDDSVLIDPLAIEDLSPMIRFLRDAEIWMHGADYDMTMFKREFGEVPEVIYDTQIGARLLGSRRFGLGNLVQDYFGVELSKSSQKADWGKRPLSEKMIEYALNDVDYLLEMGDMIVAKLKELGRYDWFLESCEAARLKVLERDDSKDDAWRVQGAGKLDRRGLAWLRALWHWRDKEAESWDRPSFMVATNRQLVEWSTDLASGRKVSLPRHYRPDRVKRFRGVVEATKALPEDSWPERPTGKRRRRDRDFDRRVDELIRSRDAAAKDLDIEGSLIASRAVLESLAAGEGEPQDFLLKWQVGCLGVGV